MSIKIGMLWLDTSKDSLEDKVLRAAEHYQTKYGQKPTECQVYPGELKSGVEVRGIRITPGRGILPGHFFIGMSNLPPLKSASLVTIGGLQYTVDELKDLIEKAKYMAGMNESGCWAEEMLPKYQTALREYEEKHGLSSAP